jgi:hypothetical protein
MQHLFPRVMSQNQPLPCELCASAAISNVVTRAATSARRFTTLTPTTAGPGWRCWAVVPALNKVVHSYCLASDPYHLLAQTPGAAVLHRAQPGALAKEVACAVGFNDFLYCTRACKRQIGVCASRPQAAAGLS